MNKPLHPIIGRSLRVLKVVGFISLLIFSLVELKILARRVWRECFRKH